LDAAWKQESLKIGSQKAEWRLHGFLRSTAVGGGVAVDGEVGGQAKRSWAVSRTFRAAS